MNAGLHIRCTCARADVLLCAVNRRTSCPECGRWYWVLKGDAGGYVVQYQGGMGPPQVQRGAGGLENTTP